VLALDLPGHGESPDQLPHSIQHIVGLIHQAVEEAGLETPVMVGHSIAGAFASVYAVSTPHVASSTSMPRRIPRMFSLLRSREDQIRGDGFPGVWR
jgi:pimeloyl-ACP methyl ester carboxylesterase